MTVPTSRIYHISDVLIRRQQSPIIRCTLRGLVKPGYEDEAFVLLQKFCEEATVLSISGSYLFWTAIPYFLFSSCHVEMPWTWLPPGQHLVTLGRLPQDFSEPWLSSSAGDFSPLLPDNLDLSNALEKGLGNRVRHFQYFRAQRPKSYLHSTAKYQRLSREHSSSG